MKLTPLNIRKQEFAKSFRGYDVEEVQAFLDQLASDVEVLLQKNESLASEVEALNEKVIEFQKIEKDLQNTLIRAQESSSKAIESAKRQTSLMVKEAEIKASQILEEARSNSNEIRNAAIKLKEERNLIVAKLKAIVNSQRHLLESKVTEAGEELSKAKQTDKSDNVDIDVDDIVKKLL